MKIAALAGLAFVLATLPAGAQTPQDAFVGALTRIVADLVKQGAGDMANVTEEKQAALVTCMSDALAGEPAELKQATVDDDDAINALTRLQNSVNDTVDATVEACFNTAFGR